MHMVRKSGNEDMNGNVFDPFHGADITHEMMIGYPYFVILKAAWYLILGHLPESKFNLQLLDEVISSWIFFKTHAADQ